MLYVVYDVNNKFNPRLLPKQDINNVVSQSVSILYHLWMEMIEYRY